MLGLRHVATSLLTFFPSQPTITGMTESISTSQGVSFVASGDTVTEKPVEPDEKQRRPNCTMTV